MSELFVYFKLDEVLPRPTLPLSRHRNDYKNTAELKQLYNRAVGTTAVISFLIIKCPNRVEKSYIFSIYGALS